LTIHDISGREVADLTPAVTAPSVTGNSDRTVTRGGMTADQTVVWDASAFPAGIYFARLASGNDIQTVKMVLVR
jgi:hypothetical protein